MTWTQVVGFIGIGVMTLAAIPQMMNTKKVSKAPYTMLMIGAICYLTRAIAIHEPVFIISNLLALASIFLVWRRL